MVNAAVALFAIDRIARRYLSGDKRLLVLLLLLLTPFYQFQAQRFASNQTLLSTWPIATYCFLRAFETRGLAWSAAAGATAALAMLGKYYSIYLVAAFIVAALAHPARWTCLGLAVAVDLGRRRPVGDGAASALAGPPPRSRRSTTSGSRTAVPRARR